MQTPGNGKHPREAKAFHSPAIARFGSVGADAARTAAEKSLAPSDTTLGAKADSGRSVFWMTDVNLRQLVYVSRGYEAVWGRSCASFYADVRSFLDAVHPADRRRVTEHYERQKQGVPLDQEYRIIRPDGTVRWIWDRRSPTGDSTDRLYSGIAQDITDRKVAEQALLRHDSVVQSTTEAIISTTLEGVITAWNPAAEQLFGYAAKEAIGNSVMLIVPLDQANEEAELLDRAAKGEAVPTWETKRRHRDGQIVDVSLTVSPLRDQSGRITGAATICRDITRQKAMHAALLESERCFRETFEHATVGIAHIALDGRIVRVNRKLCEITGHSRETILQQTLPSLAEPEDRLIDASQMSDLIAGKIQTYAVEKRFSRRNEFPVWVECTVSAAPRAEGASSYLIVIVQDIANRRELVRQLRQAQKMEAIGQLAGGIAHDFNNVLAYVTMRAELTSTYPDLPPAAAADLEQIRATARRATHLTRQLLMCSRDHIVLQPQNFDVNELVAATFKMLQRILGEDLNPEMTLHPHPIMVHMDPGVIDQMLLNLGTNARDAMPNGGSLQLETSEFIVEDMASRPMPNIAPGRYVCLRVSDTGIGIPPEHLPRIFQPFFTTKPPGKGTGLGLAMVSEVVKQQHGWITVDSEVGRGTTFKIFLPALAIDPAAIICEPAERAPERGTETILLVEDEADLRATTALVLERQGYQVLTAANGAEATAVWRENAERIALVLTDMILPDGMSGRELAAQLQQERPGLKVLFTTGYSPEVAGRELQLREGQNFLPKPWATNRLFEMLRQSLAA